MSERNICNVIVSGTEEFSTRRGFVKSLWMFIVCPYTLGPQVDGRVQLFGFLN